MNLIQNNRNFMKCPSFENAMSESDQKSGILHPTHGKAVTGELIELPPFEGISSQVLYADLLDRRRSERVYTQTPITQDQLAFILWSAQGIQAFRGENSVATLRPVPSGGARHAFELYMIVQNVEGLKTGIYRYAPAEHIGEKRVAIEFISAVDNDQNRLKELLSGQGWATKAPVVLFISCIPYRAEWRYNVAAHRVMLIDLGHLGQNVMLSAASLGLGSCCVAAYDQNLCDSSLGLDGTDEYTVYAVPIGVPK